MWEDWRWEDSGVLVSGRVIVCCRVGVPCWGCVAVSLSHSITLALSLSLLHSRTLSLTLSLSINLTLSLSHSLTLSLSGRAREDSDRRGMPRMFPAPSVRLA